MAALTPQELARLEVVLDVLIPPNDERGIPGAGAFGVARFITEMVDKDSAAKEALHNLIAQLAEPENVNEDALRKLEADAPEDFAMLIRLTYMGYYSRPEGRAFVGVAAWPVHPKGYQVPAESEVLMDTLTTPVRARGRIYRDV